MKKVINFTLGLAVLGSLFTPSIILAEEIVEAETIESSVEVIEVDSSVEIFQEEEEVVEVLKEEGIIESSSTTTEELIITTIEDNETEVIQDSEVATSTATTTTSVPELNIDTQSVVDLNTGSLSTELSEEPLLKTINLIIRNAGTIIFNGQLTATTSEEISIADNNDTLRTILADSVLGIIHSADLESDLFEISDLQYYSSFDSFLINCVQIKDVENPSCFNWQFVVNDAYPFTAIEDYILNDSDTIYFYFGIPRRVTFATTTVATGALFEARAEKYDYINDAWLPLPSYTIGATQPNPNDPWSPLEIATSTTSIEGIGQFMLTATGTYNFGLKEDFYFPTYPILIIEKTSSSTDEEVGGDGSGGGGSIHKKPNLENLLNFLDQNQRSNGSFGADLYSDWAAIAYGRVTGHDAARNKLINFLSKDTLDGSAPTDLERRAMALMALGLSPYDGGKENYIKKIVDSFGGDQIGEKGLINDDVFAILALSNAGYDENDEIIKKVVEEIISKQSGNGSLESADLTAAAVQALDSFRNITGVNSFINKAISYLKNGQGNDGSFGNSFATSWIIQALYADNKDPVNLLKSGKNPFDFLASLEQGDGGLEVESFGLDNRVWTTSYAIPAILGLTWNEILNDYSKEVEGEVSINTSNGGGGNNASTTTESVAVSTSTIPLVPTVLGASTTATYLPSQITLETTNGVISENIKVSQKNADKKISVGTTTESSGEEVSELEKGIDSNSQTSNAKDSFDIPRYILIIFGGLALIGGGVYVFRT